MSFSQLLLSLKSFSPLDPERPSLIQLDSTEQHHLKLIARGVVPSFSPHQLLVINRDDLIVRRQLARAFEHVDAVCGSKSVPRRGGIVERGTWSRQDGFEIEPASCEILLVSYRSKSKGIDAPNAAQKGSSRTKLRTL